MTDSYKPIIFPQDEKPHEKIIEWWYFNGHLWDEKNNQYPFMHCLFKANAKKVKLPLMIKSPLKNLYFEHSMISDVSQEKFHSIVNPICLPLPDHNVAPLLFNHYWNTPKDISHLIETKPFYYHLKTKNINLFFESTKKPMLENQTGFIDLGNNRTTWYYSLSNLKTQGHIKIENTWLPVTGKSWHDHQWADAPYKKDFWLWFCLQLENDTEIVCFEYGRETKTRLATIMDKNCVQQTFPVKIISEGENWISKTTGASYPLQWKIKIPQAKIEIVVKSLTKNQEMLYGPINYWEGGLGVQAVINGQNINGFGFAELVGMETKKKFTEIYREQLTKKIVAKWKNFKL
ncbi:MAG: lipocalin-like domain-containing protein [Candidatus Buchananbacteria bacterium]